MERCEWLVRMSSLEEEECLDLGRAVDWVCRAKGEIQVVIQAVFVARQEAQAQVKFWPEWVKHSQ